MMALDTNVLVRFLVRDDERQAQAVYTRFKQAETARETLFVTLGVVLELIWVLESAYALPPGQIADALDDLRTMRILAFEAEPVLQRVLSEGRSGTIDLADLLLAHAANVSDCDAVLSFDKKACRHPLYRRLH